MKIIDPQSYALEFLVILRVRARNTYRCSIIDTFPLCPAGDRKQGYAVASRTHADWNLDRAYGEGWRCDLGPELALPLACKPLVPTQRGTF